ncbi:MAG: lysophospholipid acyltransferase family protein [Planctomycetaceae bacterium]
MSSKLVGHFLLYLLARVVISLVQAIPLEACGPLCRGLAYFLYDGIRLRRKVLDENIAVVLPQGTVAERRALALKNWEHLLLMAVEVILAPRKLHETNWRQYMTIPGKKELVRSMLTQRPKVAVTMHFGNFEIAGYMTGLLGFSTYTVARTLDNPFLDAYLNRVRSATGQFMLPKIGSAPQADIVLQTGGTLVLLGDQNAGAKGCWVDFFNRPTSCHKALALFTLTSNAPMIAVYCCRSGKPMHFEFGFCGIQDPEHPTPELAGVKQLTQWYNTVLEKAIRKYPEQYWWVHRRWKAEDAPRKKQPKASEPGPTDAAMGEVVAMKAA